MLGSSRVAAQVLASRVSAQPHRVIYLVGWLVFRSLISYLVRLLVRVIGGRARWGPVVNWPIGVLKPMLLDTRSLQADAAARWDAGMQ
jgi:hypothetical protein